MELTAAKPQSANEDLPDRHLPPSAVHFLRFQLPETFPTATRTRRKSGARPVKRLAWVIRSKYLDGRPLYRQAALLGRLAKRTRHAHASGRIARQVSGDMKH